MTVPVLELLGVTKRFAGAAAVRAVNLVVAPGEYFCIVGPSGSGKSTVLRMLAGLETPDEGEIRLAGRRVDGEPPETRSVNTVFQGYALFPHLSVFDNVAFGLRMSHVPRDEIRHRVEEALALVGLAAYGGRRPGSLSGGEQQRVALARGLVNRPAVLLLDEPLAALDRKLRVRMREELSRLQRESGIAFIHVTHDQEEALRLGDRLGVMNRGRLLQVGPPAEVYRRPRTAFVADFLGSANLFRASVVGVDPPRIQLPGGTVMALDHADSRLRIGEEREYAVRPEALRVAAAGDPTAADRGLARIPVTIVASARVGAVDELQVKVGSLVWSVHSREAPEDPLPEVGAEAILLLHPTDLAPLVPEDPVDPAELER
ncbi:MAG: ABC transporter ATP-binding protein [Gemmatimonadetes bacterium]|nr:ABC transporter ATP-binding protein [Gemmatimonadota bacterium]